MGIYIYFFFALRSCAWIPQRANGYYSVGSTIAISAAVLNECDQGDWNIQTDCAWIFATLRFFSFFLKCEIFRCFFGYVVSDLNGANISFYEKFYPVFSRFSSIAKYVISIVFFFFKKILSLAENSLGIGFFAV